MNTEKLETSVSSGRVRLHARRVALSATVLALVVYLLACTVADLVVVDHLYTSIDARLAGRLVSLTHGFPKQLSPGSPGTTAVPSSAGDFDDAPILAWFVPAGATKARRLSANAPLLPVADLRAGEPVNAGFAGRTFRLEGIEIPSGRIVVATSTEEVVSVRSTLLLVEGILAPIILLSLFLAATIIGRRAAAPIERARLRQLEFTADASHELRTPLSVIEAEVGLALSSDRTAPAYRIALERVADESKRLRSIVDDLLWLARLDALPASPPQEPVDVANISRACSERFGTLASHQRLTISFTQSGELAPIVVAPADWLDRLVSVLLDNACRYTNPDGRVEVTVASTENRVTVTVDDSGPGIAEEERQHILLRFHRASTVPGGAGLGLSIANAVVKATGGTLSVATARFGGAHIEVSWPRFRAEDGIDTPSVQDGTQLPSARPFIDDAPSDTPISAPLAK
ncbi:MAG: HAMP domain-containing sensor histidine kinase [Acidimicrobiales bacterium]